MVVAAAVIFPNGASTATRASVPSCYALARDLESEAFENVGVVAFRRNSTLNREIPLLLTKRIGVIPVTISSPVPRSYWALVLEFSRAVWAGSCTELHMCSLLSSPLRLYCRGGTVPLLEVIGSKQRHRYATPPVRGYSVMGKSSRPRSLVVCSIALTEIAYLHSRSGQQARFNRAVCRACKGRVGAGPARGAIP